MLAKQVTLNDSQLVALDNGVALPAIYLKPRELHRFSLTESDSVSYTHLTLPTSEQV